MMWAPALILGCLVFAAVCFAVAIAADRRRPWPRARNRFHRGTLPPPSQKCQRGGIEALTP